MPDRPEILIDHQRFGRNLAEVGFGPKRQIQNIWTKYNPTKDTSMSRPQNIDEF